jgi:glycosyltransferase involved in cell wall biosynthesis
MKISLFTGADDPSYALPMVSSLTSNEICCDFIGNDNMQDEEAVKHPLVNYLNFRGDQNEQSPSYEKIYRILKYYYFIISYTVKTDSKIFHILWLNKFTYFDRTLLNLYYKLLGKSIVFTAHNINDRERDGNDTVINRFTLRFMYRIVDHIFVHTQNMKDALVLNYGARPDKISVINFGLPKLIPRSGLTRLQAKRNFRLNEKFNTILFFGRIVPYKGLELLIVALDKLRIKNPNIKLLIIGKIEKGCDEYWEDIQQNIQKKELEKHIITRIEYIPDEEIQNYFKAADVLILPYKNIYQSGPLFMSYYFGLPVIASDVGSFKKDVVEGKTGFIFKQEDPINLAQKIEEYFGSDLYKELDKQSTDIVDYAEKKYSWSENGKIFSNVYDNLL